MQPMGQEAMNMEYRIYADGSFDIDAGSNRITGAYPAVDGVPLRALGVTTGESSIRYTLMAGELTLQFCEQDGMLTVAAAVEGLVHAHDIAVLDGGRIEGCDRSFVQGLGMEGPSGFAKMDGRARDSHGVVAVGSETQCLAVYACDHSHMHNFYRLNGDKLTAGFDTERVPAGALPVLYFRAEDTFHQALHGAAKDIAKAMNARPVTKAAFHWCSWYYLYHNIDQPTLESYLEGFSKHKDEMPFTHIQLDAGYFNACGDWLDLCDRFPQGLKHAADTIRAAGYEPGVWVAPYIVGDNSRLYREHPDWVLRDASGEPIHRWRRYNEPKMWGYRDCDYFILDTSHPDAMDYLRHVFTTLREWGFTLYKTDFLFWGLQDSTKVIRHTPGKTSVEYYRDVMDMIRECIGEESRWLGCISPFMPAIGYCDMMRIAGDVGAQWEEGGFGPANMLKELTADDYFNNVFWQNDPDAVMLRDFHIHLKPEQIEALALLEAMSGSAIYTSDPVHLISRERQELLSFIRPRGIHNPEYPFWSEMREEVCLIQRLKTRQMIYFFNATDRPIIKQYDWNALLGDDARYLRRWKGESARTEDVSWVQIPPRSGVLYFATAEPMEEDPDNLWEE